MKCPHCEYEDGINGNVAGFEQGSKGDFYTGGTLTRQNSEYTSMKDSIKIYGCPSCMKMFIDKTFY